MDLNEIKNERSVGKLTPILFEDNYFDLVISINTIHNLEIEEIIRKFVLLHQKNINL